MAHSQANVVVGGCTLATGFPDGGPSRPLPSEAARRRQSQTTVAVVSNSMMSFLSDITSFSASSRLRPTDTVVTRADGRQYRESRDKHGRRVQTPLGATCLGYTADVRRDLQVGEVRPGLLVGSQDVAADFDLLQQHRVTHILNLAYMVENIFPEEFTYKRLNILDLPETNITDYFPECFEFISEALGSSGCVLVHCNAGVSRSTSVVIGYLMFKEGLSFDDAYQSVKDKRPAARPNDGFLKQLKSYRPNVT